MSKRILLIDSDESFAQSLESAITARGLEATVASNSEQGISLAKSERPDLIVVCVEAQPTNGYMLCTRLKKDEALKGIPVILTSANATAESFEKHKKLKTRADEYLIKPFAPEVLLQKAAALLDIELAPAPPEEEVVTIEEDEPLGLGDLVQGEDEPVRLSDAEAAEAQGLSATAGDDVEVEEEEQLAEAPAEALAEPPAAGDDDELKLFDAAFDSLSPVAAGHHEPPPPPAESDEQAFAHLHLAPPPEDATVAAEEKPAEAPLDEPVASEASEPAVAPLMQGVDPEVHAALEQKVAQLESDLAERTAELQSAKKGSGTTSDLLKLKSEGTKKDKEVLKLKEELNVKEKELIELRESQTELEVTTEALKQESSKREAAAKALQHRAEALAAAAKKFERELSAAREELKAIPALKTRLGELETIESAQAEVRKRHEEALAKVEEQRTRADALVLEVDQHKARAAELETELSGARALRESEVEQLKSELEQVRTDVAALTGEKDLLGEEREDLRRQLAEAASNVARGEERALKAYQRIKSDEKLREKARKALEIALQLLAEAPAATEPGAADSAEKQSA